MHVLSSEGEIRAHIGKWSGRPALETYANIQELGDNKDPLHAPVEGFS